MLIKWRKDFRVGRKSGHQYHPVFWVCMFLCLIFPTVIYYSLFMFSLLFLAIDKVHAQTIGGAHWLPRWYEETENKISELERGVTAKWEAIGAYTG